MMMMRIAIVVLGLAVAQASSVSKNDDNDERRRLDLTPWEIEQLSSIFDSSSEDEAAYYYTYGHDAGLAAQALRQSDAEDTPIATDDDDEELCNYAPSVFNFEMDLSKNCNDETLSNNVGIDGSICFYTYGADDDASADDVIAESNPFGGSRRALRVSGKEDTNGIVVVDSANHRIKDKNNSINMKRLLDKVPDISSHIKHAQDIIDKDTHHNEQRIMQTKDPVPTKITSVTFVEFDNKIADIINQNSTYFDTELYDGDKITYPSIASKIDNTIPLCEQTDLLPGGIMLILFGINKDNVIVRNTIAWAYKLNDCIPVESQGDTIGWVKVDNYTPPVVLPLVATSSPVEPLVTLAPVTPAPVPYPTMPPVRHVPVAKSVKSNKSSKGKSSKGGSHSMSYPVHHTYHAKSTKSAKAFGHAGKSAKGHVVATKVATYDPKAQKISTKSVKAEKMFTKSGKAFGKSSGKATHVARPVFTTSSTGMSVSMEARGEDYDPYMGLVSDSMSMDTAPWE